MGQAISNFFGCRKESEENEPLIDVSNVKSQRKEVQRLSDSASQVDYILAYNPLNQNDRRKMFIQNLVTRNLKVEYAQSTTENTIAFIKVHAPSNVIDDYASRFHIPIKSRQMKQLAEPKPGLRCMRTKLSDKKNMKQPTLQFTSAERIAVVSKILAHTQFGNREFDTGLSKLVHTSAFIDAYALHDGKWQWTQHADSINDRQLLAKYWANFSMWYKVQPLSLIEKYFGPEVAIYFAWLGFYNKMLISASIFGVATLLYAIVTVAIQDQTTIEEVCNSEILLCPTCKMCQLGLLRNFCFNYKLSYVNDNIATVLFAFYMSFWATLFMEMWKREQSVLLLRWNLATSIVEEYVDVRREYLKEAKVYTSPTTGDKELYIPTYKIVLRTLLSVIFVVSLIIIVLAITTVIIIYEIILRQWISSRYLIMLISAIATLIVMTIFRKVYMTLAAKITHLENPRTELEFDKSYMIKILVLASVNSYAKLMYLSFIKGKFFTYPGDKKMYENNLLIPTDVCAPSGCVTDVFILFVIIMILRPLFWHIVEYLLKICCTRKKHKEKKNIPNWESEYNLTPSVHFTIVGEFGAMVMQYGFITLFVVAFPLAPLLALLHNIIQIRIDATKIVKNFRRPEPRRIACFQVWFDLLQTLTYLAVITNGLFIAFTSNFIPKLVYRFQHHSLWGYINSTLSVYNVEHYDWEQNYTFTTCRYEGYRNSPLSGNKYEYNLTYYHILSMRLLFALVYIMIVFGFTGILAYAIPDVPKSVQRKLANYAIKL